MDFNTNAFENQNDDFNIRQAIERNLNNWQWFVVGVCICLFTAFVYLRYTVPQYQANTSILVKDDKKGGMLSELSAFSDLGLGNGIKSNLDNEVEVLKSRSLAEKTVLNLGLNVALTRHGKIVNMDIYDNAPIRVLFSNIKPSFFTDQMSFDFVSINPKTFELSSKSFVFSTSKEAKTKKQFRYGQVIPTQNGDLIITKMVRNTKTTVDESRINILVNPLDKVVESYRKRTTVEPISKTSSVVNISMKNAVYKRAELYLDKLVSIYNEDAAADKNFISESTSKFIAERLLLITQELDGVEKDAEQFKTANKLTDIETEAKLFIEGSSDYNKKKVAIEIQANMVSSMLDFIKKSSNSDLLPTNMISTEGDASAMMDSYNKIVLERNRILKSATIANPSVIKLDQQLASLKLNIMESLGRLQSNLGIQKRDLGSQERLLNSKIGDIPVQERQFRVIARQQKVKEELYLYLLQKREETAISLAATEPNARVIDSARASKIPVFPKPNMIYLVALLIGLLIPFGIIYIRDLLDTKVKNRFDITDRFDISYLGDVPNSLTPDQIIDTTNRSSCAEALRIVRTNLDFMLSQVPEGVSKNIFLTSTIPGEGKTFLSVNLASIFALSGKKVLLIGMDIRSPKLNGYLGLHQSKGLTDYLSTKDAVIGDYISKVKTYETLDVLLAGSIPPNPTELLMNPKVDELFAQFKKEYDFVVVDNAPVSLVSDTFICAKNADTFVYVVRANVLDKRLLSLPEIMHRENKLPNMAFLLNDTKPSKGYGYGYGNYGYGGYGYGYGYGVTPEKKPWFKEIFKK